VLTHGHATPRSILLTTILFAFMIGAAGTAHASTVWLCKPGASNNPCETSLTATVLSTSGSAKGTERTKIAKDAPIDCFYVYPTVSDQTTVNANRHVDPAQRAVAYAQASRFSQNCRVWAPMYRQLTLSAILTPGKVTPQALQKAYSDVLAAWQDYLANHNKGRGVVLIGHSQGTFILRQLVKQEIDGKPSVRKRLVSALLIGGDVTVRQGEDVGGDFQNIRACRSAKQAGCVVAYSTFGNTPPPDSKFGRTDDPGLEVLCTNPAALGGGSGTLRPYLPVRTFPGTLGSLVSLLTGKTITAPTPWAIPPGRYTGRCERTNGANVLHADALDGAQRLRAVPDATWGLHLADVNLPLGNLTRLVSRQSKTYLSR
jgi:hypothetical protein